MITPMENKPRNILSVLEGSPRNVLAVLEGSKQQPSARLAGSDGLEGGIFEVGGFFDNLFSIIRSTMQDVTVAIYAWLRDKNLLDSLSQWQIETIVFAYSSGVKEQIFSPFGGMSDPNAAAISAGVAKATGFTQESVYNVLFALKTLTDEGNTKAATILNGTGISFSDRLNNTGPVGAISKVAHNALDDLVVGLGLPVEFVTLAMYAAIVIGSVYVYKNTKDIWKKVQ